MSMTNASITKLRQVVTSIERIERDIGELNGEKADVFADAKGFGLDVPALRMVIAERRRIAKDPRKAAELLESAEIYRAALEVSPTRPSRARARGQAADAPAPTPHDPDTGEIIERDEAPAPNTETGEHPGATLKPEAGAGGDAGSSAEAPRTRGAGAANGPSDPPPPHNSRPPGVPQVGPLAMPDLPAAIDRRDGRLPEFLRGAETVGRA